MKKKTKKALISLLIVATLIAGVCIFTLGSAGSYQNKDGSYKETTGRWSYSHFMNHPLFAGWGEEMFDWNNDFLEGFIQPFNMDYVGMCMGINVTMAKRGMNFLIENANAGNYQVLDFYTEAEKSADFTKESTGLIYIPGDEDKPFAVICAGGAYKCVAMVVEGFPIAKALSDQGYPVFLLKYRVSSDGSQITGAYEDLSRAIGYILDNQKALGIENLQYSLWGFSAGGNLIYNFVEGELFCADSLDLPVPSMLALGYGAVWSGDPLAEDFSIKHPEIKTYMCYGKNDGTIGEKGINWAAKYQQYLTSIESSVRYDLFDNAPHGFGDGEGTDAAGWVLNAIEFWESK